MNALSFIPSAFILENLIHCITSQIIIMYVYTYIVEAGTHIFLSLGVVEVGI